MVYAIHRFTFDLEFRMLRKNENKNCWDGKVPFKLDFSQTKGGFIHETSISVRSRNNIKNEDVNEAFFEVMEHLGHLSQKLSSIQK